MAKQMNTKAELQISTQRAVRQIETLAAKLNELKKSFGGDGKALAISLSIDTKEINKVTTSMNKMMENFQKNAAQVQSRISQTQSQALRNQQNAYQQFWDSQLSNAEKYAKKINEIKLAAQQQEGIQGYNVMTSEQRQAKLGATFSRHPSLTGDITTTATQSADMARLLTQNNKNIEQNVTRVVGEYFDRRDRLQTQIDQKAEERAARQARFQAAEREEANAMEKARALRAQGAQAGTDRRQLHSDQREVQAEKDIAKLQRNLLSASNQYTREQQKGLREREKREKELENNRKAAIKDQNDLLRNQIDKSKQLQQEINTAFDMMRSGLDIFSNVREISKGILGDFQTAANEIFNILGLNVGNLLGDAVAQEESLQLSRIGFANMFGEERVDGLINRVRQTAAESPGLNSADLADYIAQLGAVADGADQAFDVTMGILKTVQYGGGDANSQMNYIIKNIRDVMAKGKATQVDVQQFNRAMPLLVKTLEATGQSEFLKDGELKITKDNAKNLMQAFAALNDENSPAANIFSQTGNTWSGVKEEFYETTQNTINEALRDVGFYELIQSILRDSVVPIMQDVAGGFSDLALKIKKGTNWKEVGLEIKATWKSITTAIGEVVDTIIDTFATRRADGTIDATDSLKTFINMIGKFFTGLIDGVKTIIGFIGTMRNLIGDEGLGNIMGFLGNSITAGWITSKVGGGALNAVSGLTNMAFESRQLSLDRQILNNLKILNGTKTSASVATTTGLSGKFAQSTLGRTKLGGWLSKTGNSLSAWASKVNTSGVIAGLAISKFGGAIGKAITQMNLLGDASDALGLTLSVGANGIGGAMQGISLGFGKLGAGALALLGVFQGLADWWDTQQAKEAQRSAAAIDKIRAARDGEIVDTTISTFVENGGEYHENDASGVGLRKHLEDMVANTPAVDLDERTLVDETGKYLLRSYVSGELAKVDNTDAWVAAGNGKAIDLTANGAFDEGQPAYELYQLLKEYQFGGLSAADMENMTPQEVVEAYLEGETLTQERVDLLRNEATKFREQYDDKTTDVTNAMLANDEKMQQLIDLVGEIKKEVVGETEGDKKFGSESAAVNTLGENGAVANKWQQKVDEQIAKNRALDGVIPGAGTLWEAATQGFSAGDRAFLNATVGTWEPKKIWETVYGSADAYLRRAQEAGLESDEGKRLKEISDFIYSIYEYMSDESKITPGDLGALANFLRQQVEGLKKAYGGNPFLNHNLATGGYVKPIYRASGGPVGVDTVPAMLSPGEFVQRASAVQTAGLGVLTALNQGDLTSAYRLLGAKIHNNSMNASRSWRSTHLDNSRRSVANVNIVNRSTAGAVNSYRGLKNYMAL